MDDSAADTLSIEVYRAQRILSLRSGQWFIGGRAEKGGIVYDVCIADGDGFRKAAEIQRPAGSEDGIFQLAEWINDPQRRILKEAIGSLSSIALQEYRRRLEQRGFSILSEEDKGFLTLTVDCTRLENLIEQKVPYEKQGIYDNAGILLANFRTDALAGSRITSLLDKIMEQKGKTYTVDDIIQNAPQAIMRQLIVNEYTTIRIENSSQKEIIFDAIDSFLAIGQSAAKTYQTANPLLTEDQRVKLARILDDLSDMISYLRGVNPSVWDKQGYENRFQEQRAALGNYLRSEANELPALVYYSTLVKYLLSNGLLCEEHTPGMPSLLHSHHPRFTGKGLDAIKAFDPYDQETLYGAMTAFQVVSGVPTDWEYTALDIQTDKTVTETRVTEAQIDRKQIAYVIPNSTLFRLRGALELARNVREGHITLNDGIKDDIRKLAGAELELLDKTLQEISLFLYASAEIGGVKDKYWPKDQPGFDPRQIDGIICQDIAGVDTSLLAARRMQREKNLVELFDNLELACGYRDPTFPNSVLMPRFNSRVREMPDGTNLTPQELRAQSMNHFQYAAEVLGKQLDGEGVVGPSIEELLKAVKRGKEIIEADAKRSRARLDYDTVYSPLNGKTYDGIDMRSAESLTILQMDLQSARKLIELAQKTGRKNDAKTARGLVERLEPLYKQCTKAQFDLLYAGKAEPYALRYAAADTFTPKTAIMTEIELMRETAYRLTELAKETGDINYRDRASAFMTLINGHRCQVESETFGRSDNILRSTLGTGRGTFDFGDRLQLTKGGPRDYDFRRMMHSLNFEDTSEPHRPTVDAELGEDTDIREGRSDMNWHATVYCALTTAAALSMALQEAIYLDPNTRKASFLPQDTSLGMVDVLGTLSRSPVRNVRGNPFESEAGYWRGPHYDLGVHNHMAVTSIGPVGSGVNPNLVLTTCTSQFTLAGGDLSGYELWKSRQTTS